LLQLLRAQAVTGDATPLIGHTMRVVNFPGLMSDLRSYVKGRLTEEQRRRLRFEQQRDRYAIVRGQERLELDTPGVLTRSVLTRMYSSAMYSSAMYSSAATTRPVWGRWPPLLPASQA